MVKPKDRCQNPARNPKEKTSAKISLPVPIKKANAGPMIRIGV